VSKRIGAAFVGRPSMSEKAGPSLAYAEIVLVLAVAPLVSVSL
jgi:hypothetical protein